MSPLFNFSNAWLLLLGLLPLGLLLYRAVRAGRGSLSVPLSTFQWTSKPKGRSDSMTPGTLRLLAMLSLVPIVSGIGSETPIQQTESHAPALMIVLDSSSSMTAEDFKPENRLQEAKKDLKEFVARSPDLEIGLIVFASTAQLLVPITPDHETVQRALDGVSSAAYGEDGTAIGSGIASAANRLRSGTWPERSILLITDGVSNRGAISPLDAARLAKELSIPIHAVGIGSDGMSRYFVPRPEGGMMALQARIEIDDDALRSVARESGGAYERVRSSQELAQALLRLRPGAPQTQSLVTFGPDTLWPQILALLALLLLGAEFILTHFVLSELPG